MQPKLQWALPVGCGQEAASWISKELVSDQGKVTRDADVAADLAEFLSKETLAIQGAGQSALTLQFDPLARPQNAARTERLDRERSRPPRKIQEADSGDESEAPVGSYLQEKHLILALAEKTGR
jgi:hypothetical protein